VDGLEICKHLKSGPLTWHLPVIILSATPHVPAQIKQVGADAFLEKPFSNHDLLQVAASLVNSH
jgi:CheY-like chemotaxis protein